jgi:hypothetical protein
MDHRDLLRTVSADLELISRDLASVHGTLSEITAVWRRAREGWLELPHRALGEDQELAVSGLPATGASGAGHARLLVRSANRGQAPQRSRVAGDLGRSRDELDSQLTEGS